MNKLLRLTLVCIIPVVALISKSWAQQNPPPPQTLATAGSWSATVQGGNFSEIGSSGQDQVAMIATVSSKHFTLTFSGYAAPTQLGTTIPIQISFDSGKIYELSGRETATPGGGPNEILTDLPDDIVAPWTHDLTADTTMTTTFPHSSEAPWIFALAGTTPTVTALAKAITDAGITGLPPPWMLDDTATTLSSADPPNGAICALTTGTQTLPGISSSESSTTSGTAISTCEQLISYGGNLTENQIINIKSKISQALQ